MALPRGGCGLAETLRDQKTEEEGIDLVIAASRWKRPMKDNKVDRPDRPSGAFPPPTDSLYIYV